MYAIRSYYVESFEVYIGWHVDCDLVFAANAERREGSVDSWRFCNVGFESKAISIGMTKMKIIKRNLFKGLALVAFGATSMGLATVASANA